MKLSKSIGKAIKARRKELKLTQKDLEDFSGIKYTIISDIENGKNSTLSTIEKIMEPLGITFEVCIKNKL